MANLNTIAKAGYLPGIAQGASSTAEFQFKNANSVAAEFTIPADKLTNRRFKIVAGGTVTGGTTTNFTAILYAGTALATSLFSSGAKAVNSTSGAWHVEAELLVDATGKVMVGTGTGAVNATMVTPAVATAASQDPATALTFSVSGTFSASHASNAAKLAYFELEIL